jgi:DeoR/GlpR family transcriptional regulator of sugar metabolism
MDKKVAIAEKAAALVRDEESVILDSGSTDSELAKRLTDKRSLTVVTNALNIALLLGAVRGNEVLVTAGIQAADLVPDRRKGRRLLPAHPRLQAVPRDRGISPGGDLTYPGLNDIPVKKAMIESANEVYLLADSTKFGKTSLAILGGIELVDYVVTDNDISDEHRNSANTGNKDHNRLIGVAFFLN